MNVATQKETHGRELLCKRCGRLFACHADGAEICQCKSLALHQGTAGFLGRTEWGCLCVDCLREIDLKIFKAQAETVPAPGELIEGVHYYMENRLCVFTEYYHMLRGHCCRSGCRHCAYGYKKDKGRFLSRRRRGYRGPGAETL